MFVSVPVFSPFRCALVIINTSTMPSSTDSSILGVGKRIVRWLPDVLRQPGEPFKS